MQINDFINALNKININTFVGVPDSTLQVLCEKLAQLDDEHHMCTVNEGAAIALAAGHYLASEQPCCVYMQNSGIGNAVNPIASLTHGKVYDIPMLLLIGYRGEPNTKDEPQHKFQGEITLPMLDLLEIEHAIISNETTSLEFDEIMTNANKAMQEHRQYAIVVKKSSFTSDSKHAFTNPYTLIREDAISSIIEKIKPNDVIVSTTGKISREVYESLNKIKGTHSQAFLTVGSMGHASMIALGIAKQRKDKTVYCIDGDGAALMHLGSMAFLAEQKPANFVHIILNNEAHESVGGMSTGATRTDFSKVAMDLGYTFAITVDNLIGLHNALKKCEGQTGPVLIEVKVAMHSRSDLGRPKETPIQNKENFMKYHEVK